MVSKSTLSYDQFVSAATIQTLKARIVIEEMALQLLCDHAAEALREESEYLLWVAKIELSGMAVSDNQADDIFAKMESHRKHVLNIQKQIESHKAMLGFYEDSLKRQEILVRARNSVSLEETHRTCQVEIVRIATFTIGV